MSNILAANADGVDELMLIGTALKRAKNYIEDNGDSLEEIDKALAIVDKLLTDGFASI